LTEITESQRLWEAWFQAFSEVREACPNCDGGAVRIAYMGDPGTPIGTAFAWCESCRQGISVCRVGIPHGAAMATFDASEEEQDAIIPADIDFLPADPVPPADGVNG
jgi:hypothetical protein